MYFDLCCIKNDHEFRIYMKQFDCMLDDLFSKLLFNWYELGAK